MLPNIAFTVEPTNPDYIITEPQNDNSGENQLNISTLDANNSNITNHFQIKVTDPTQTQYITDFTFFSSLGGMGFAIREGILDVYTQNDGRYAFSLSSKEADLYGYTKPFVYDVVDGVAYRVAEGDTGSEPTLPVNPDLQITGLIELPLREGVFIGTAYDHHGQISPDLGIFCVFEPNEQGEFELSTYMEVNADGSIALPKEDGIYRLEYWPFESLILDAKVSKDVITVEIAGDTVTGARDMQLNLIELYPEPEQDPLLTASFYDPTGTEQILDYYIQTVNGYSNNPLNFEIIDGNMILKTAQDGRYGVIFTPNGADTYGYSEPFVFDIVEGVAYTVAEGEASPVKITEVVRINAREGIVIGKAYDHHGAFTFDFGHISVEKQISENTYEFITDMAINADGTIAMPKEDGAYKLILWPFDDRILDVETIHDELFIEISGDTVTGARDMRLMPTQVSGTILDPAGNPIAYEDYWVEIQDGQGNHLTGAQKYFTENGLQMFSLGRLPEGTYQIIAQPNWADSYLGIFGSEPLRITVDSQGIATPAPGSPPDIDLLNVSLKLRSMANEPLKFIDSFRDYVHLQSDVIEVDVRIENSLALSPDDFKVELIQTSTTEVTTVTELTNSQYKNTWKENAAFAYFSAKYLLDGISLNLSDTYKIRLTDTTKAIGKQVIEFPITVTDKNILFSADYLGKDSSGSTGSSLYYHVLNVANGTIDHTKTYPVTVYDAASNNVGEGTLAYDPVYKKLLMKTEIVPGAEPFTYIVEGTDSVWMHQDSNRYSRVAQPYQALWTVTETADQYAVNLYNEALTPEALTLFELAQWDEFGRHVKFPSAEYPEYTVTAISDFLGGVQITFPKSAISNGNYFNPTAAFGEYYIGNDDLFFVDESQTMVMATLYDPSGNTRLFDFEMWEIQVTPGSHFNLAVAEGKVYFDTEDDGDYQFVLFTTGADTYAMSQPLFIKVVDGIAYYGQTPEVQTPLVQMPHNLTLNLQEGIKIGNILDTQGTPDGKLGYVGINRIDDQYSWTWLGGFKPKADGSIYVPIADGYYEMFYDTWANLTDLVGTTNAYTISGGTLVAPVNFQTSSVQFTGTFYTAPGKPVTYQDFNVAIFDAEGHYVQSARIANVDNLYQYKVGGLPEGAYTYKLEIYDYYVVRGYTNGEPVPFTIAADGTATVAVKDIVLPKGTPQVFYSSTEPTRGNVTATLDVGKEVEIISVGGRHHEFDTNGEFEFKFLDFEGKTQIVVATVSNIDRVAPSIISTDIRVNGAVKNAAKPGDTLEVTIEVLEVDARLALLNFGTAHMNLPMTRTEDTATGRVTFYAQLTLDDAEGQYDLSAVITDAAGNQAPIDLANNFAIDETPPTLVVSLVNPLTNTYVTDDAVNIRVSSEGQTFFGTTPDAIHQDTATLQSFLNTSGYNDGLPHTLYFIAVDASGNTSEVKSLTFKWDNTAPTTPIVTGEAAITHEVDTELTVLANPGTLEIRKVTEAGTEMAWDGIATGALQTIPVSLREGENTFIVKSIDAAGHFALAEVTVTRDSIAPIIEVTLTETEDATGTHTMLVFETEPEFTVTEFFIDGAPVQPLPVFEDGNATYELFAYDGNIQVIIKGEDAVSNEGTGRFTSVNITETQTSIALSEGITLQSGGFNLDTNTETDLKVYSYAVSAGEEQTFIGDPIQFSLGGTATVDPAKGVVVDIVIDEPVGGELTGNYPADTKLNYFDEVLELWIPLNKHLDHGDSLYNHKDQSIWVTVDPSVLGGEIQIAESSTPGAYEILPGHILGFLRHFSGYAVLKDNTAPVVQIQTPPLEAPINAETLTVNISLSEEAYLTINGVPATESTPESNFNRVIDLTALEEGAYTFTISATDLAGFTSSTETFDYVIDRSFESLLADLNETPEGTTLSADSVLVEVNATDTHFSHVVIGENQPEPYMTQASAFQTSVALVEGLIIIDITAYDTAGNKASKQITLTRDTTGPALHLEGLNDGDVISGPLTVAIVGDNVGDLASYDWTLTRALETLTGQDVPVTVNGTEDTYTLVVQGYDALGNMTRLEIHFSVNVAAPEIIASTPDPLSNDAQSVSIAVAPMAANTVIKVYKDGVRIPNTFFSMTEDIAQDQRYYEGLFEAEGSYQVVVDTILGTDVATKVLEFVIDLTPPEVTITGVEEGVTYKDAVEVSFVSDHPEADVVTATLKAVDGESRPFASGERLTENGKYLLTVTAVDSAQNTTVETITFTLAIPEPEEPFVPTAPSVLPGTVVTEKLVTVYGQRVMAFDNLGVTLRHLKSSLTPGTEITLKRYKANPANAIIPMVTKKDVIYKLTSDVYKVNASKPITGDIKIIIPYDDALAGKENRLSIACYDAVTDSWVLVKGTIDKRENTITFTTDVLSYFMVVESVKNK